ncbi:polysaccharide deacetylase family protein [Alphaproteobacteria bacterium]|nr:polysaccharide deacetylase family protein [Alphaproteobacteria bacterium]
MTLEIVTYHYVRPIKSSRYPKIKGLELSCFQKQLEFFLKERHIVSTADVLRAIEDKIALPKNAIWLTFDDGYKDHYEYVVPLLERYGVDAAFFPVTDTFTKNIALDVNKIQYILAIIDSENILLELLKKQMFLEGFSLVEWNHLWNQMDKSSRFDTEKIIFFKRLLQRDLPIKIRQRILTNLFLEIANKTSNDFVSELYMSKKDLISLHQKGFTIGSHTASHSWLNSLTLKQQEIEIENSLIELKNIRGSLDNWIMCYPYGAYNEETLSILSKKNCAIGLTTKVGKTDLSYQNKYELSRLDTNDFFNR